MADADAELERFRQQWRAEVTARSQVDGNKDTRAVHAGPSRPARRPPAFPRSTTRRESKPSLDGEEDALAEPHNVPEFDGPSRTEGEFGENAAAATIEPQTALEHYEKAVEREAVGSLGDSLDLYRKAFRLDDRVDVKYKNKHFPPSSFASKSANPNPSNAAVTVPNPAHHSLHGPPQTIKDLIAGFAGLAIEPAPPAIEGTPAPPSPLAQLPEEILIYIFTEVAILDVAAFVQLAQVCKRMAYLVATEEQIWKRITQGSEVGFGAMHFQWQRELLGGPLKDDGSTIEDESDSELNQALSSPVLTREAVTLALLDKTYSSSWRSMFRLRPRIRFNGCYISTVNYTRPGQASVNQVTWNSPVYIVTYYRYLRFFRDGTVISLLSTTEPAVVVHHLTKDLQELHRGGAGAHLPSIDLQYALRGRWRLSSLGDSPESDLKDAEGDLFVETESPSPKYIYRMKLSLQSAGKGAKNNKLVWQGFWDYNVLTDDTGEFTLRNDKAFFWSRVKSYGNGA